MLMFGFLLFEVKMNVLERVTYSARIPITKEAYNSLHVCLGDDVFRQYSCVLKLYFSCKISKLKFDEEARKLLCSPNQIHLHNLLLLSLQNAKNRNSNCRRDNLQNLYDLELSLPNEELMKGRVCVSVLEHGLDGAADGVTDILILAVKVFLKNILTAMVSQANGYKIRENNFQHGIGVPIANPWLRNTSNIIDVTQDSNITVNEDEQTFEPVPRDTLETTQQQTAFAYSCSATVPNTKRLTLKCLYETLLHNPHVINNHSIYSVNLEKILSLLDCS